ncbi:MAG: hypothetical protein ACRDQ7_22565 [Haloechinothrix sp.]
MGDSGSSAEPNACHAFGACLSAKLRAQNTSVLGNHTLSHLHQGNFDAATLHEAIDIAEVTRSCGGLNVVGIVGRQLCQWRG